MGGFAGIYFQNFRYYPQISQIARIKKKGKFMILKNNLRESA